MARNGAVASVGFDFLIAEKGQHFCKTFRDHAANALLLASAVSPTTPAVNIRTNKTRETGLPNATE